MAEPLTVDWYAREVSRCRTELAGAKKAEAKAKQRRKDSERHLETALVGLNTAILQEDGDG